MPLLVGLAACPSGNTPQMKSHGTTNAPIADSQILYRAIDAGNLHSLDPSIASDAAAAHVLDDLFEGLLRLDQRGEPTAGVATNWDTSQDGRIWTFHLRVAHWSNGVPIRAQDFVYAWRRTVDPHTASDNAQALSPVVNALAISAGRKPIEALGVEAVDALTLRVLLNEPTPYLLSLLTKCYTYPQFAPAIRAYGDEWVRPGHMISNGAFTLQEHVFGGRVTLTKNLQYWDANQVRLRQVVYWPLDRAVQTERYFAGDLSFTDSFSAEQTDWLRKQLGTQVVSTPFLGTFMLGLNAQRPPFRDNRALRLALSLAVDREVLVHFVRQGLYEPAWTLTPPLHDYLAPVPAWAKLSAQARHLLAKRYLAAAGYGPQRALNLDLHYPTDSDNRRTYEAVAAMWRSNLGVTVNTYNEEFRVQLNARHLRALTLFHYAWLGDYPDPYTFLQLFTTGFGYNDSGYTNSRYDTLLAAAGGEADAARRLGLLSQAETLLNDDAAYIPIYYYATRHLIKPYVRGWTSNIQDRNLSQYMYLIDHRGS